MGEMTSKSLETLVTLIKDLYDENKALERNIKFLIKDKDSWYEQAMTLKNNVEELRAENYKLNAELQSAKNEEDLKEKDI